MICQWGLVFPGFRLISFDRFRRWQSSLFSLGGWFSTLLRSFLSVNYPDCHGDAFSCDFKLCWWTCTLFARSEGLLSAWLLCLPASIHFACHVRSSLPKWSDIIITLQFIVIKNLRMLFLERASIVVLIYLKTSRVLSWQHFAHLFSVAWFYHTNILCNCYMGWTAVECDVRRQYRNNLNMFGHLCNDQWS